MPITHAAANADLDARYGSGTPASHWFALLTSLPDLAGAGYAEPTDANYARLEKVNNATNFPAASSGVKQLATVLTFGTAAAAYTVVGIAIFDASTAGNLSHYQQFSANVDVAIGEWINIAAGELQIIR